MRVVGDIENSLCESARTIEGLKSHADVIAQAGEGLVVALKAGHKILTAGNGGSAAEALHMAEELVGRFKSNRVSLPGIALAGPRCPRSPRRAPPRPA